MSGEHKLVMRVSAHQWRRVEVVLSVVGWALAALTVPFVVLAKEGQVWAIPFLATFGIVGISFITSYNVGIASDPAAVREGKAGYTTILLPHQPELDLVEPTTGIVIRAAGERALTEEEYKAAVLEARSRRQDPRRDPV